MNTTCRICLINPKPDKGTVCHSCRYAETKKRRETSVVDVSKRYECIDCKMVKSYSDFYTSKVKLNGISSRCKLCESNKYNKRCEEGLLEKLRQKYIPRKSEEDKKKVRERVRKWKQDNMFRVLASCAKRRASKLKATPKWANFNKMLEIYKESQLLSKTTGKVHHVDHIVPLISDLVCGLHCEQNLRVVLEEVNLSKGNRHWLDMPD